MMIRAKNYEKLSKFIKVMAKILSVPFFPDTVYIAPTSIKESDAYIELRYKTVLFCGCSTM